jgi:hypothetical protein
MSKAPIVLFVYNRPDHTRATLESLSKNILANESDLFVYCDGPKEGATLKELKAIDATREIVKGGEWCRSVKIIENGKNKGLAESIVEGVSTIVNQFGKIIVLEDDIITSRGFLKYMNDALDFYEETSQVMHVSGYMFPLQTRLPETLFYNVGSCWSWGTWKNRWDCLELDESILMNKINLLGRKKEFNIGESYNFFSQLEDNFSGKINTWAVKWYASFFLKEGFALHPGKSLVNNIGHDSSGVHCGVSEEYSNDELASEVKVEKIPIKKNKKAYALIKEFNLNNGEKFSLRDKFYLYRRDKIPRFFKTVYDAIFHLK